MKNKLLLIVSLITISIFFFLSIGYAIYGANGTAVGNVTFGKNGEIAIADGVITEDFLKMKKEIVGASGKKVDILQSEKLGIIVEVVR